jgi:hypothetical protein
MLAGVAVRLEPGITRRHSTPFPLSTRGKRRTSSRRTSSRRNYSRSHDPAKGIRSRGASDGGRRKAGDRNAREYLPGQGSQTNDGRVVSLTGMSHARLGQRQGSAEATKLIARGAVLESRGGELSTPRKIGRKRRVGGPIMGDEGEAEKQRLERIRTSGQRRRRRRGCSRRRRPNRRRTNPFGRRRRRRTIPTLRTFQGPRRGRSRRIGRGNERAGQTRLPTRAASHSWRTRSTLLLAAMTHLALGEEEDH